MATKAPEFTDRKPRADAQRNRERILEEAKKECVGRRSYVPHASSRPFATSLQGGSDHANGCSGRGQATSRCPQRGGKHARVRSSRFRGAAIGGHHRHSKAPPQLESADTRAGAKDCGYHSEESPRERQHALECADLSPATESQPHHGAPRLATPRYSTASRGTSSFPKIPASKKKCGTSWDSISIHQTAR